MHRWTPQILLATAGLGLLPGAPTSTAAPDEIQLQVLGTYATGIFDDSAAEIPAYDPVSQRVFVVNGAANMVDVLDIADPSAPQLAFSIDLAPYGAQGNSVGVHDGVVAVAVQANVKTDPGAVVFFDTAGSFLDAVAVGALPDMLVFTKDGEAVLVANEGEPDDDYLIDPEGSVSIVRTADLGALGPEDVDTVGFSHLTVGDLPPGVRVYGPGATVAQDFEPEYIALSRSSRIAWVTLQENNALAVIDVRDAELLGLIPLGVKDHSLARNALDASNEDGGINIGPWPVHGMYLPDAVASYTFFGLPLLILANEGDSRDYDGFSEEERVRDLLLDPVAFPDAAELQRDENLGRLKITNTVGDDDGDGDYDRLYSYGGRSFSIWTGWGHKVYDSGRRLEEITAAALPADFNSDNTENGSFDDRSDDKGPEPEGVTVGRIDGRTYAFIGLERVGGIAVFDVTFPWVPRFVQYVDNRDFTGDPETGTAGDLGPEGLLFIAAGDSPIGEPLLVVANEVSGTTTIYSIDD